jgi:hypothetical protein
MTFRHLTMTNIFNLYIIMSSVYSVTETERSLEVSLKELLEKVLHFQYFMARYWSFSKGLLKPNRI